MKGFNSIFQKRLNELLEFEKYTDAAKKTGVNINALKDYIYGKTIPKAETWEGSPPAMELALIGLQGGSMIGGRQSDGCRLPAAGKNLPRGSTPLSEGEAAGK